MLDAPTREHIRRRRDEARRRDLGAGLDADGRTGMQANTRGGKALAIVAWDACDGDALAALTFALDVLEGRAAAS